MVLNAVANWLMDFVQWFLGLLPTGAVIPTSWISQAQGYMGFVGMFIDIPTLVQALGILVTFYTGTLVVRLVIWLWHVVRP